MSICRDRLLAILEDMGNNDDGYFHEPVGKPRKEDAISQRKTVGQIFRDKWDPVGLIKTKGNAFQHSVDGYTSKHPSYEDAYNDAVKQHKKMPSKKAR